jgi:hypothetical protein
VFVGGALVLFALFLSVGGALVLFTLFVFCRRAHVMFTLIVFSNVYSSLEMYANDSYTGIQV